MPIMDDLLAAAATKETPRTGDAAQASSPIMRSLLDPVGSTLDDSFKAGSSWDQTASRLKDLGVNPDDHADKKKLFDLAQRKKELSGNGMSFSQAYRGQFQPFGSVVTLPESVVRPADYVARGIGRLAGGPDAPIGGRVVGTNEYNEALNKFKAGDPSADDIDKIATYEHHAKIRQDVRKGANFLETFMLETGGLGTLAAETMAGGAALSKGVGVVGRATGLAGRAGAAPAAAAVAGSAPAVPVAAGITARGTAGAAANLLTATAVTPSMYVPMMQQANQRAGRTDANDPRGMPTAFGYAYANMLVLGRLSGGRNPETTVLGNAFKKGVLGVTEMQAVDAMAGVADQFLNKAYQFKGDDERFGTIGSWLRAYRAGDKEKASEVLRDASVQALAFGSFAAIHGREKHADDLMQSYVDTVTGLRKSGVSKDRAGEIVGQLHAKLETELSANPYLSREQAREAVGKDVPAPLKEYANKLVDTFQPKAELPTPAEIAKTDPVAAAATPEPPKENVVQDPTRKPGDPSEVVAADPTQPNPERVATVAHSDGTITNADPATLKPAAAAAPEPIAPTAGADQSARIKALRDRLVDIEAGIGIAKKVRDDMKSRSGVSPGAIESTKRTHKNLVALRSKMNKQLAELERQPQSTAATDSKAPGVAPVEPKIETTNTPAEPTKPAAVATGDAAVAIPKASLGEATRGGIGRTGKTMSGETINRHEIVGDGGKSFGHVDVIPRGDHIHIEWIGGEGAGVDNAKDFVGKLGAANVRRLLHDFAAKYPDAQEVRGLRVTGARTGAGKKDQRTGTRLPGRGGPERRTEDKPAAADVTAGKSPEWIATYEGMKSLVGEATAKEIADKDHPTKPAAAAGAPLPPRLRSNAEIFDVSRVGKLGGGTPAGGLNEFRRDGGASRINQFEGIAKRLEAKAETERLKADEASRAEREAASELEKRKAHEAAIAADKAAAAASDAAKNAAAELEAARAAERKARLANVKPPVAAPSPNRPKAGSRPKAPDKAAVAVEPAAEWQKLRDDPGADRRVLAQILNALPKDSPARDSFEDVLTNVRPADAGLNPKAIRRNTIEELWASYRDAQKYNRPAAVDPLAKAIEHFGGKLYGEPGERVGFDPRVHQFEKESPGVSPGAPVEVRYKGVELYDDGKADHDNAFDYAEGSSAPVNGSKAVVVPAKEAAAAAAEPVKPKATGSSDKPTKEQLQEQYDYMSASSKRELRADPVARKPFEEAGIDFGSTARPDRKGTQVKATFGLEPYVNAVKENRALSSTETIALVGMDGKSGVLHGVSLRGVAKRTSFSHQTVSDAADRALAKMKNVDPKWNEFETVQDVVDKGVKEQERIAAEIQEDRIRHEQEKGKPASLLEDEEGSVMLGAGSLPVRVFDAVFGPSNGRSAWQRLSATLFGNEPSMIRAAREQEVEAQIAAYAFDVRNATKDLKAALKAEHTQYELLDETTVKRLDEVLRTKPTDIAYNNVRNGIGPKTLAALDVMRAQVDKLSDKLIDVGAIPAELVATVDGNMGTYLTRQFAVFRDPAWAANLDTAVVNRFKSWLTSELTAQRKGVAPTVEEVDARTRGLLLDGTAAENPLAMLKKSGLGAKDLSILKSRKDIPPELRALWGEYRDPLVNYTNSVAKMAHLLTSHNFLARIAKEGTGKIFFPGEGKADGDFVHSIGVPGDKALGPLAGMKTSKEIKQAMEAAFAPQTTGYAMQQWMKFVAAAKFNKTILSHVGQAHNFLSNIMTVVRNGNFDVRKAPAAAAAIWRDTPSAREYWRRLTLLGVVGEGIHYNDFSRTISDAEGGRAALEGVDPNSRLRPAGFVLSSMLKAVGKKATDLYQYGDAVFKVYAFENEKAKYEKIGYTPEAAEQKAAEVVRDTMPTYSKIAPGLQALRRSPVAAPFIAFQAEMVRTTKNAVVLAFKEMADPKTRAIGAGRLAGLMAAATIPAAAAAATRAIFGIDKSEEDAMREFVPEWEKNSRFVYYGRDPKTGAPRYTDLSKIDSHAYMSDGLIALFSGSGPVNADSDSMKAAVREWGKPFTQEELLLKPVIDISRNRDDRGADVYNAALPPLNRYGEQAKHVGQAFVPAAYGPLRRLAMAFSGDAEQKSGKEYDPTAAVVEQAGVRFESVRVREDLKGHGLGFEKAKRDADKLVLEMIKAKGTVRPEELQRAKQLTEDARQQTIGDMAKKVSAAERLGLDRHEIAAILKSAGVSNDEIQQMFSAVQKPYRPAVKGTGTERERAIQVRTPAGSSVRP